MLGNVVFLGHTASIKKGLKEKHNHILSKKNQNCRQPKLKTTSGQIDWVISYHQDISRSRYAGDGENYRGELQDVRDLFSKP